MVRFLLALAALTTATLLACGGDSAEERSAAVAAALEAAEERALASLETTLDSAEAAVDHLPGLTANVRYQLRQYLNQEQVATARRLGVDPPEDSAAVRALVEGSDLVALEDSTRYWVVRELTHSFPYVTDDARAMLEDLGRRFHSRLDSLGLPPLRFEITSALRTGELQADLRSGNPNASRTTSSHEFGTTVDIAYTDFAPPADLSPYIQLQLPDTVDVPPEERERLSARLERVASDRLDELGDEYAPELKGVLGNVLETMQEEGAARPLHERSQPIFHTTVAESYPGDGTSPSP